MPFTHTFVVPSYNQAGYIAKTVDALLRQTVPTDEIVITEDASTDDTMSVLGRYEGNPRVRIVQPGHLGMARNWNNGVREARTEWVSIMGADDVALPNFVAAIRDAAEKHPRAVVISADFDHIDGQGNRIRREKVLSVDPVAKPPDTLYAQMNAVKVHPAAHAFRRAAWEKVGGFPETLRLYGDWGLWLNLAPEGEFVHLRKTIAQYRVDYRPGIGKRRVPDCLHDDSLIQLEIIPSVARRIGDVDWDRIAKASRLRFRSVLADTSELLDSGERDEAKRLMEPWAKACGEESLLARFAAGERITVGWRAHPARRMLRELYKRLR
jgi:glycosyltransferase involved in cell wall biosynthesis